MELERLFFNDGISLRDSLDFVSDGIIIVDTHLDIVFINKSGQEICGVVPQGNYTHWPDVVGVYHSEDLDSVYKPEEMPIVRALKGESLTDIRLYLNNKILKSWRCISSNTSPIRENDIIIGAIISFRDITEKLVEEEALQKKYVELEKEKEKINEASKLAALGFLAAEMGHEINNPLAIIRSSSWIMRKILTTKNVDLTLALTKLDEIDLTVERIREIITSVKNLSRNNSQDEIKNHLLGDIFRDVKNICGPRIQPKGMELRLNLKDPLMNEKILCSRIQISEVFINLLINAIDSIEGKECPWVQIDVLKSENNLTVRFTDCGDGIPPEIEEEIFNPFFSTKPTGKGTGLGLSISKKIMKKHGGDLILNRAISASCFDVNFPLN